MKSNRDDLLIIQPEAPIPVPTSIAIVYERFSPTRKAGHRVCYQIPCRANIAIENDWQHDERSVAFWPCSILSSILHTEQLQSRAH